MNAVEATEDLDRPFALLDIEDDGRLRRLPFIACHLIATLDVPHTMLYESYVVDEHRALRRFARDCLFGDIGRFLAFGRVPLIEHPNDAEIAALHIELARLELYGDDDATEWAVDECRASIEGEIAALDAKIRADAARDPRLAVPSRTAIVLPSHLSDDERRRCWRSLRE